MFHAAISYPYYLNSEFFLIENKIKKSNNGHGVK